MDLKSTSYSNNMNNLEQFFPGETEWLRYAYLFKNEWDKCIIKNEILENLEGHKDIAMVMYGYGGETTLRWINQKIPSLDNLSPKECLNDSLLLKRLKSMLMRMK